MPDYFEWSERMAEKLRIPESGDYRDSDLYRELWADARKVVDDALHEALGLQEYLIALNLPNTAAKLDSEIGAFQTLADAIKSICDRGELAKGAEEVVSKVFQKSYFR